MIYITANYSAADITDTIPDFLSDFKRGKNGTKKG